MKLSLKGKLIIVKITRNFHLINGLKCGFLIRIDIIGPEEIILDTQRRIGSIQQAKGAKFPLGISALTKKPYKRTARASRRIVIQPHTIAPVEFDCGEALPSGRDLLFTPETTPDQKAFSIAGGSIYACAITSHNTQIFVHNNGDQPLMVHKYIVLGKVGETDIKGYYMLDSELHDLASDSADRKALIIKRHPDKERAIFCRAIVYSTPEEI